MTPAPRPGGTAVASRPDLDGAACKGADLNLFFPEPGDDAREARAICARCPVLVQCDEYAAASGQRWGIWAGVDREHVLPVAPEPPVPCSKGLHLMTPENSKPLPGTLQVRCKACLRDNDRRTATERRARSADARNARDRKRYAEQKQQQEVGKVA